MLQTTFTRVLLEAIVVLCLTVANSESQDVMIGVGPGVSTTSGENIETLCAKGLQAIDGMLVDPRQLVDAILRGECDTAVGASSKALMDAVKSVMIGLVADDQASYTDMSIPDVPSYSYSFTDNTNITRLTLTNLTLKGVDKMEILKYNLDVCTMYSEIELNFPKLEVKATYELEGNVNGYPITGAGDLSLMVDTLYFDHLVFMDCNPLLFSEDVCRYSLKNKTVKMSAQKVQVNLSGVKYMDLTEPEINDGLNAYINDCVKSNKFGLVQNVADEFVTYYNMMTSLTSPVNLLNTLKDNLKSIQQPSGEERNNKRGPMARNLFGAIAKGIKSIGDIGGKIGKSVVNLFKGAKNINVNVNNNKNNDDD